MSKVVNYDWGELKVQVEEARVFDTKAKKFVGSLATAKVEEINFEKLTNEVIKRGDNVNVPFVVSFNKKWFKT